MAKEVAEVAPHVYKVLYENEQMRLLEVQMKPGDKSDQHSHPNYLLLAAGRVQTLARMPRSSSVPRAAGRHDLEAHSASRQQGAEELTPEVCRTRTIAVRGDEAPFGKQRRPQDMGSITGVAPPTAGRGAPADVPIWRRDLAGRIVVRCRRSVASQIGALGDTRSHSAVNRPRSR
jgi:hypothetical protein